MKSRTVKTALSILIFLSVIAIFTAVSRPIYTKITGTLNSLEEKYVKLLEDNTGLSLSYSSLSPSLLSGINIRNAKLYNVETQGVVVSIKKISVKYSILSLIKGDFENAFTKIIINNAFFEYDVEENVNVTKKLMALISADSPDSSELDINETEEEDESFLNSFSSESIEKIKNIIFMLPIDVAVKNIQFHVQSGTDNIDFRGDRLFLEKDKEGGAVSLVFSGSVFAELPVFDGKSCGFNFEINAKIMQNIQDSSIFVTLNENRKCIYSVKGVEFLVRYDGTVLTLFSIQQTYPYSLSVQLNMDTLMAQGEIKSDNFDPYAPIKLPQLNKFLTQARGSLFTVDGKFFASLSQKTYSWKLDALLNVSKNITPEGEYIQLSAAGDNENISVPFLKAWGGMFNAQFEGSASISDGFKPEGVLNLEYFKLYNGSKISCDAYLDTYGEQYSLFIPQLYIGDKTLTAVIGTMSYSNKSLEFAVEASDYSHADYDSSGSITVEGSYLLGKSPYVETIIGVNGMFADSIAEFAAVFLKDKVQSSVLNAAPKLEPYIFSTEVYLSTNLKNVTYNSPYSIMANTRKEGQILILSFDGSDSSINISQLDLVYNALTLQTRASADFSLEDKQGIFSADFMFNSIPYYISGAFTGGESLSISGDYGLDVSVHFGDRINGTLKTALLPVAFKDFLAYVATDVKFEYENRGRAFLDNPFLVNVNNITVQEVSKLQFQPSISIAGDVNNAGFVMSSVTYTDSYSILGGNGMVMWNFATLPANKMQFSSLMAKLSLDNELTSERIDFEGNLINSVPDYSGSFEELFVDAGLEVDMIGLNRFIKNQNDDNTLSAQLYVTGALSNPSVMLNLDNFSMSVGAFPLIASGNASLDFFDQEEWNVTISDLSVDWNFLSVEDVKGSLELNSFTGKVDGAVYTSFLQKDAYLPVEMNIKKISNDKKLIPDMFLLALDSEGFEGTLYNSRSPLHVDILKNNQMIIFTSDEVLGLSGSYNLDSGALQASIKDDRPLHFKLNGLIDQENRSLDVSLKNLYLDTSAFTSFVNTENFSIYGAVAEGDIRIYGLMRDPDIEGSVYVQNIDFNLPRFVPEHFTTPEIFVLLHENNINIKETLFNVKDTQVLAQADIFLEQLKISVLNASLKTFDEKGIPLDVNLGVLHAKGKLEADVTMEIDDTVIEITGDVSLRNTEVSVLEYNSFDSISSGASAFGSVSLSGGSKKKSRYSIAADLNINLAERVQIVINPIIRGIVAPAENIHLKLDTGNGLWNINGDLMLRGGEITYLSRNFYLKEGRIYLNESQQLFDPFITVRAETRERDENGKNVVITLSAIHQRLSALTPQLYSSPPKSEAEIYELLGQVATGDSSSVSGLLLAGMDFGVQVTVLRQLENALRDLLNFDIFSIRSAVLQNAVKQGLNLGTEDDSNVYSLGNFFDNTTVYIGKYFGSSVYLDAMLHWSYNSALVENNSSVTGLVFQPELGLELDAPFANIRWSVAPDLSSIIDTWVPSTSITLSWTIEF